MALLSPGSIRDSCAFHSWMESSLKRDPEPQAQKKELISQDVLCPAAPSLHRERSIKKGLGQLSDQQSDYLTFAMQCHGPSETRSLISKYNFICFYFIFAFLIKIINYSNLTIIAGFNVTPCVTTVTHLPFSSVTSRPPRNTPTKV